MCLARVQASLQKLWHAVAPGVRGLGRSIDSIGASLEVRAKLFLVVVWGTEVSEAFIRVTPGSPLLESFNLSLLLAPLCIPHFKTISVAIYCLCW